jgi:hypothetical protein
VLMEVHLVNFVFSFLVRFIPLKVARLSCGRLIGLLAHPLTPPPPPHLSKLTLFLSLPVCHRSSLLMGEGGGGRGEEPNHMTARKPGLLEIIEYSLQYCV